VRQDGEALIISIDSAAISDDTIRATLVECEDIGPTQIVVEVNAHSVRVDDIRSLVAAIEARSGYTIQALRGEPSVVSALVLETLREKRRSSTGATQSNINREAAEDTDWAPSGKPVMPGLRGGRRTTQVHGTVRSGRIVRFDGDVVLIGDVNPGAQVSATGDIFVLGKIKGEVHAGSAGDANSFIFSLGHTASQLRVGEAQLTNESVECDSPTIAFVENNQISLVPFAGKVPR
jgi:septum site-determining protein MinC